MEQAKEDRYQKKIEFAEEFALLYEETGHPSISGKILGWLLVCNPPEQSFNDLVEKLQVSKGSVSNMTRMLSNAGLIEKVRKPGERQVYYKLVDNVWEVILDNHMKIVYSIRDFSKNCLQCLEDEGGNDTERLKKMYEFHKFTGDKLPDLIEEYKED